MVIQQCYDELVDEVYEGWFIDNMNLYISKTTELFTKRLSKLKRKR